MLTPANLIASSKDFKFLHMSLDNDFRSIHRKGHHSSVISALQKFDTSLHVH